MNKILINGDLGSGKTLVGEKLAEMLGFSFLSTGNFFRDEATNRNITFKKLHKLMQQDLSIDRLIDKKIKAYLFQNTNYVVDSRMGAHFEPRAFKVLLQVDEKVGAQRILDDMLSKKRKVEKVSTLEEVIEQNRLRVESERNRYLELYKFDHLDLKYYDLKINTTDLRPEEITNIIYLAFSVWKKSPARHLGTQSFQC